MAKILLQLRLHHSASKDPDNTDVARGKAAMVVEDQVNAGENSGGYISIAMLLSLLKQPLYLRSIAHLEQVMIWFYWYL